MEAKVRNDMVASSQWSTTLHRDQRCTRGVKSIQHNVPQDDDDDVSYNMYNKCLSAVVKYHNNRLNATHLNIIIITNLSLRALYLHVPPRLDEQRGSYEERVGDTILENKQQYRSL